MRIVMKGMMVPLLILMPKPLPQLELLMLLEQ